MNLILRPFALLLVFFYNLFDNYGVALILFALVVKVILFPFSLKGKKSMVKVSSVQSKAQRIQRQYANNKQKQQEELAKFYEKEQVNPMGGCLWSFLPLLVLIPLYAIIRQPLTHMMTMTTDQIIAVGNDVLHWAQASIDHGWVRNVTDAAQNLLTKSSAVAGYNQLYMASLITPENLAQVQAAADGVAQGAKAMALNFNFLGIDLSRVPTWRFWSYPDGITWNTIGLTLMPIISAALSLLMSVVTQKTNRMSNPAAADQPQPGGFMMYALGPLMSLWIGYIMPAGLCVYWIVNSLLSMVQEVISGKLLKKDYEQAAEAAKKQALLDKEEEKRRKAALAAERAKRIEERKAQKGKKKTKQAAAAPGVDHSASAVGLRAYARGRAYDPDRYGGVTPYRDPDHPIDEDAVEKARAERAEKRAEAQLEAEVTAQVAAEMAQLADGSVEDVEKAIEASEEQRSQDLLDEAAALAAALDEPGEDPEATPAGEDTQDTPQAAEDEDDAAQREEE